VYQGSLAEQRGRLAAWSWRSPAGATSEGVLLRQLRMTLKKKSPTEARKMAERSRRHATHRQATTPFTHRLRRFDLDKLIHARLRAHHRSKDELTVRDHVLGMAWAELTPHEQRRAVRHEYGPKVSVSREGKPWEEMGFRRLRLRQDSAATSIQGAYRLWRQRRVQRAQATPLDSHALQQPSTWVSAAQQVKRCGRAVLQAVLGRVRRTPAATPEDDPGSASLYAPSSTACMPQPLEVTEGDPGSASLYSPSSTARMPQPLEVPEDDPGSASLYAPSTTACMPQPPEVPEDDLGSASLYAPSITACMPQSPEVLEDDLGSTLLHAPCERGIQAQDGVYDPLYAPSERGIQARDGGYDPLHAPRPPTYAPGCNALVDTSTLTSHPIEDVLRCKHVQVDGGVRWNTTSRTGSLLAHTLSAVRDEEGPLLLVFYAYLRGHRVKVLVDSGASDNFISAECAHSCKLAVRAGTPMKVTLADGSVKTAGEVAYTKFTAHTASGVNYCEKRMALRVLPLGIQVDVVLGGKWLRSLSPVTLDYSGHGSVSFETRANGGGRHRVVLAGCNPGVGQGRAQGAGLIDEVFLTATQLKQHLVHAETRRLAGDEEAQPQWLMMADRGDSQEAAFTAVATDTPLSANDLRKEELRQDTRDAPVSSSWKQRFDAFFDKYLDTLCSALPEASKLRRTEEDKARIERKPDAEGGPPCRRPYKMTAEELRQLRERIEQLMEKGYIRPSSSPYAAPCLMVPKPGDPKTLRLVVDYRQLNQQTVRDRYPLPDIQLMFDEMQGAAFFSSFDAVDGFWQVPMAEEDVEKTAFTTQMGAYEWLVMPQGLQNSPSQYQRRMQRALGHLPFVRIFIDDVVVFSRTVEEHYDHVRQFLDTCREKGVYLKASKAQMLKESLRFLGHTLSAKGCQPQHDKVASIKDWPKLETVTHVRQFLGLAGYYRRFVHRFSEIAQPLTSLTKTDTPWQWGELQQWAFEELKTALSSAPVLALPDMQAAADGSAPFLVQTDASGVALGGVLMQDTGEGMRVIAYDSRQFSAAEQNYHTGERELCALHHCTTVTWRHYLFSSDFRLQGDHRPLEWLMSPGRELSRRQARWYMDLVEVGVPRMEYVKGALLLVPDALSRRPDYVAKDPREGLKEAGVVDKETDLPKDPLSVLDSDEMFEDLPPAPVPSWVASMEAWLDGVETLQVAERAMEDHILRKIGGSRKGSPKHAPSSSAYMPHTPVKPTHAPCELPHAPDKLPHAPGERGIQARDGAYDPLHAPGSPTPAPDGLMHTPEPQPHASVVVKSGLRRSARLRQPTGETTSPRPPACITNRRSSKTTVSSRQPPQSFDRTVKQPADRQDWKVRKEVFERLQHQFGSFDVDACCDLGGRNRQVNAYWSNCLQEQWRGKHVWCNPPYSSSHLTIEAVLRKYVDEWRKDPAHTSAVFLLPDIQARMPQWRRLFRMAGMRIVEVIPTHDGKGAPTQLFETPDGVLHDLPWPVLVVHAPPTKQLQPRVRYPRVAPPIVRQGKAAEIRDALDPPTDATFLESLKDEYARAGPLHRLRDEVLAAPHHATRDFRVVGEVLWRVAAGRYQLVLGEDSPLREVVFREAHDSLSAGHTGREKTLERVLRRFWWKNASEDVAGWVASCPTCQSVRPRASYPDGLLNPHAIPQRNWQDVSVDFVTGLPLTTQGNDAFVTFTCKLSKMVHLVPMNFGDSSAQAVARIYFDVVWRQHGAPMKIVCDRDPRFQDSFWRELMRLMGVRVASTTPYNPRSDGQAEHTNRVVEDMLRSFVGANPVDWDLYMTNVEFAINDSRSDVTGFTPFELCYGVSPMSQLDIFLEAAVHPGSVRRKGGVGTAHEMAVKFSSQLRDARSRLELAQQRQREQFDKRHRQHRYKVGDLVWIEARHLTEKVMDRALCRKLGKRWHGPVPVVECFYSDLQAELAEADRGAPVAYRLALPPHWRIHDVFAQHRLKPYVAGTDEFATRAQPPVPDPVMVDGQAEAHVDKILAYRVRLVKGKSVEEWKVRWTGYSAAHDQWRTRDKMDRGGENQQLKEFEERRLSAQTDVLQSAGRNRRQRQQQSTPPHLGVTLSQLMEHPCDETVEMEPSPESSCLPWERVEVSENGELAYVTDLEEGESRPVRILVLFSGTGSVEKEFVRCFPSAAVVTLDNDPRWQPTHLSPIAHWDPTRYPPGYFDVVWASPPCTQYSQARTTGGPPDLKGADRNVKSALDIIEYLKPKHWFLENPEGRYPNALRLRPVVRGLPQPLFCTYCKYGERYRKPTCIWTSSPPPIPLLECTARTPCVCMWATGRHPETAQLGPQSSQRPGAGGEGARNSHAVYPVPAPLLYHLFHHLKFDERCS